MTTPTPQTLGQQIRAFREAAGASRRMLGNKLGVDPMTIYHWERGDWSPAETIRDALAAALGCTYQPPRLVAKPNTTKG